MPELIMFMATPLNTFAQLLATSSTVIIALASIVIAFFVYRRRGKVKFGNLILDFETRRTVSNPLLRDLEKDLNPAERQYLLLKAYHEQSLGQSRISMWFSLIFAAVGFAVIIVALFVHTGPDALNAERLIKLASGTVIDAVAGLFFVQSNKARELMATFFDKLRTDRKLDESLRLAEVVPDEQLRSRLQLLLSLNFAEVKIADETLLSVLAIFPPGERLAHEKPSSPNSSPTTSLSGEPATSIKQEI